jgi:hypothetical protein
VGAKGTLLRDVILFIPVYDPIGASIYYLLLSLRLSGIDNYYAILLCHPVSDKPLYSRMPQYRGRFHIAYRVRLYKPL